MRPGANPAANTLRRQRGLTLVELMVALLLSLVLMYGVVTVFMANKQTFQVQEGLSRVQETGRYAIQALVRDLRRAGYRGCDSQNGFVRNTLNGSGWQNLFDTPIQGYNAAGSKWSPAWATNSGPTAAISAAKGGSDVVQINFVEPQGLRVTQHNQPSADIKVPAKADLKQGDIAMVTDCRDSAIFQITNVQTVSASITNIVHNTGNVSGIMPGNSTKNLGKRFTGGDLLRLVNRIYYVGTGISGEPSLFRVDNGGTPMELAEGVEALQLLFGEDTDADGIVNAYRTANNVADWKNVLAVRVGIVARSSANNIQQTASKFTFNEAQLSVTDRRLRKTFTATVVLRNRLP